MIVYDSRVGNFMHIFNWWRPVEGRCESDSVVVENE